MHFFLLLKITQELMWLHVEAAKVRMQLLLVAVSCAQRGITSHLLLRGEEPEILTGYNLVSKMYGNVVYVPRSLYANREEMLIRHANEVAGANGSVLWFKDLGCSAFPTNGPAHTEPERISGNHHRKVVIVNEGAGDAVALLGKMVRFALFTTCLGVTYLETDPALLLLMLVLARLLLVWDLELCALVFRGR